MSKGYKALKVWEKAHKFAIQVYKASAGFPKEELYGLTSQLRRASFSVLLNIVEGHASTSKKEFLSFLNIANRSLVETEYLLEVVKELGFIDEEKYLDLENPRSEVAVILNAFTRSLRSRL
jgi:four helix bundle protein